MADNKKYFSKTILVFRPLQLLRQPKIKMNFSDKINLVLIIFNSQEDLLKSYTIVMRFFTWKFIKRVCYML